MIVYRFICWYFSPRSHERSDCYSNISLTFSSYFNPRSHERSDGQSGHVYQKNHQISIHAPTRGATRPATGWQEAHMISIHAPTRGATLFNNKDIRNNPDFNPRSHERSDSAGSKKFMLSILFQSTLPREERLNRHIIDVVWIYFNPRSHERSDFLSCSIFHKPLISIHAPTRGATQLHQWLSV